MSLATLAANNHYTLDEPVLQMVVEKHQQEEAAQKAVVMRKMAAELKQAERQKKALEKITFYPNGLTVPKMKALVTAATNAEDSPIKSKKADLQGQLYCEPRHSRVQAMSRDL